MEITHEQARRLSSGTMATLTGVVDLDDLQEIQDLFVQFVEQEGFVSFTWVEAWWAFELWMADDFAEAQIPMPV